MGWKFYDLDRKAQQLVLNAKQRDSDSLNQAHKMRQAVAYGLERFWGEHLRLLSSNSESEVNKGHYWRQTWDTLTEIMKNAGVNVPNDSIIINPRNQAEEKQQIDKIQTMSKKLWGELEVDEEKKQFFTLDDQRVTLAVLTQLTDCLVWWTQRYK
jgi:hypothetical protein